MIFVVADYQNKITSCQAAIWCFAWLIIPFKFLATVKHVKWKWKRPRLEAALLVCRLDSITVSFKFIRCIVQSWSSDHFQTVSWTDKRYFYIFRGDCNLWDLKKHLTYSTSIYETQMESNWRTAKLRILGISWTKRKSDGDNVTLSHSRRLAPHAASSEGGWPGWWSSAQGYFMGSSSQGSFLGSSSPGSSRGSRSRP